MNGFFLSEAIGPWSIEFHGIKGYPSGCWGELAVIWGGHPPFPHMRQSGFMLPSRNT
jgi:hypothetical protein